MKYTVNQEGKRVLAVGMDGSHERNKVEFNITLPKLINTLNEDYKNAESIITVVDLYKIMEHDAVPIDKMFSLYNSAYYYFFQQHVNDKESEDNTDITKNKVTESVVKSDIDEVLDEISAVYKLINFSEVPEYQKENLRQARKKLNKIAHNLRKNK